MLPTDRRYTKEHEWVKTEGQACRVGITDFAQQELGDIVYVELPEPGRKVAAGDVLGTVESVKAVSEIYAPLAGTVDQVNQALSAEPELLNRDPHEAGWYCTLAGVDAAEVGRLLDVAAYAELTER